MDEIETLPLWENDPYPDPDTAGICDTCGGLTDDPFNNICDTCWVTTPPRTDP